MEKQRETDGMRKTGGREEGSGSDKAYTGSEVFPAPYTLSSLGRCVYTGPGNRGHLDRFNPV